MPNHRPRSDTVRPAHHGDVIRAHIEKNGFSITDAAVELGVSRSRLTALLSGRAVISQSLSWSLADVFGESEDFWFDLQAEFDSPTPAVAPAPPPIADAAAAASVPPSRWRLWLTLFVLAAALSAAPAPVLVVAACGLFAYALFRAAQKYPRTTFVVAVLTLLGALFLIGRGRRRRRYRRAAAAGTELERRGGMA